ncbi:MAG: ABC transporter ATP-binding protein [Staphylothermus sp.]|nr:ABC transporter ATP-binding protein [Staphylothermus sp.]
MTIIEIINVSKVYDSRKILDNINLEIRESTTYALLGPNGAGKTTLINIILGIIKPTSGKVLIKGKPPTDPSVRKNIGYCPQEPSLFERLTGMENLLFFAQIYGLDKNDAKKRINSLLEKLGLTEYKNTLVAKYSGGMKKKLALAIALLPDPDILILDEPTTGMDPNSRRAVWEILEGYKREGKTILLSTHYMEEADRLADIVGIIYEGKIIAEGAPEDLKKRYGPRSVLLLKLLNTSTETIVEALRNKGYEAYPEDEHVKIYVDEPEKTIPTIVSLIYGLGGRIDFLKVIKPSIEDVFVKLTGKRMVE